MIIESGGDNLTAVFRRGLVDRQIFVVDVAGGDKVPRKGGPGVTTADLLVINKIDLAPLVGADLDVMTSDAHRMRGASAGDRAVAGGDARRARGREVGAGAAVKAIVKPRGWWCRWTGTATASCECCVPWHR